jgi:hypothetical protein
MGRRLLAAAAALVLVGVLALPVGANTGPTSGVRGVLRLTHGCRGTERERLNRHCEFAGPRILVSAFLNFSGGVRVATVRSSHDGHFALALAPGRYLLRADVPEAVDQPLLVSVRPKRWTTVTLRYLVPPYGG